MTLLEMLSTKKFTLTGNIDERYFSANDDGTYKATPLFIHNVARDVSEDIKAILISLDNPEYVTHSNNKGNGYDQKDTWAEHEHNAERQTTYKEQFEAEAKLWKEYQVSHPDEFDQNRPTIATGDIPTTRFFSAYHPNFDDVSESTLMSMYKEAKELLDRYSDEDDLRDTLPQRPGNLISKPEFKEQHQKIRQANREKLGIPEDTWVCPIIHKDDRASLIRSNSKAYKAISNADGSEFEEYVNGLTTHLTGSTPEEYQKEWEEMYTNIDTFCKSLERSGRGTKFVVSISNSKNAMNVSLYSSNINEDRENRRKIAGLSKVNPTDDFYTFTIYFTSKNKRPSRRISTKAELRATLKEFITVLEENNMNEYIDSVQTAIDSIS